jgi:hypothetical protein
MKLIFMGMHNKEPILAELELKGKPRVRIMLMNNHGFLKPCFGSKQVT